ncbi:MAG: DUF5946 family protein [Planctomycetota bacterium]
MASDQKSICPGCGLQMPLSDAVVNRGYYNTSPECFSVYTEVLGDEFGNVLLFGQVHQLTVDTYAVQHAGGVHPDKSIDVHLVGLYLGLERGLTSTRVPKLLKRLADTVSYWPHFPPPTETGSVTVLEVALADSVEAHMKLVREWAGQLWDAWSPYHAEVTALVAEHVPLD